MRALRLFLRRPSADSPWWTVWMGPFNMLIFQWFFLRLAVKLAGHRRLDVKKSYLGWTIVGWIWPLTGWITKFRYIGPRMRLLYVKDKRSLPEIMSDHSRKVEEVIEEVSDRTN